MPNSFQDIKEKTAYVRNIDLLEVLKRTGCALDYRDETKWHTCRGVISVTGQKFMNWSLGFGGGGAIDLAIHLQQCDFKTAVHWLSKNFFPFHINRNSNWPARKRKPGGSKQIQHLKLETPFILPQKDEMNLARVIDYLRYERYIPPELINNLVATGKLYADYRGNAVFLLLGKEKKVVGAELRGTGGALFPWRGIAPGSSKQLGAFYVKKPKVKTVVICESAIDAISYFALQPNCMAISTSGVNPDPPWLATFIRKGYQVYCGFDADRAGDNKANRMIQFYPMVKRLRPYKKDWNEVLKDLSIQKKDLSYWDG